MMEWGRESELNILRHRYSMNAGGFVDFSFFAF